MTDEQNDETVLPINEAQRAICYSDICHAIENLTRRLSQLADYAEMVGEPQPDQMRDLQRNTIRCVHAFADTTHQLARHRRRRTRASSATTDKTDIDDLARARRNHTHPSAGTIHNPPETRFDRTGEYHDTDTPDEKPPFRYTDNK